MRIVQYYANALGADSGVTNATRGWSRALAALGHEVALAVDPELVIRDAVPGVGTLALDHLLREPLRVPTGLGPALAGADVFVLHGGWRPVNAVAAAVARRTRVPYVVVGHGGYLPDVQARNPFRKRVWSPVERWTLARALAVHVLFRDEADGLRDLGVDTPVITVPNGAVTPPDGATWDGGSGGYLLWLGRFDPEHKGLDLLVAGLAAVPPEQRPRVLLHGTDWRGQRARVRGWVRQAGLEGCVEVREPVYGDDKWELLRRAAGFVLTSRWEGSPMSLAEAIGVGLPSLVTPYAMGRYLAERGAAVLVDPAPAAVAAGVRELLSPRAADVGARALELARGELSWEAVAASWVDQVTELLPG